MAGEKLHKFDLALCDYILGQIQPRLRELRERPVETLHLEHSDWDRLDIPTWAGYTIAALPPRLGDHIWAGVSGDVVLLPLNDDELFGLQGVVDDPPLRLKDQLTWEPCDPLHRRYLDTISEVQESLTKQTAEEWAVGCSEFASKLCCDGLAIAEGITLVHEWLWRLRQLLRAMGATKYLPAPEGHHPTPTIPNPVAISPLPPGIGEEQFEEAVRSLRDAISKSPEGMTAKAQTLMRMAGVRDQLGRFVLRWLELRGEYRFPRAKPSRYKHDE